MSEQTMVERVARAMAAVMAAKSLDSDASVEPNEEDYECARAAIAAMQVPMEAMVDDGIWALPAYSECVDVVEVYTAMIDAALPEVTI